ncbi:MAG: hypothetical protein AB1629_05735 [Candidatus Omnitrophota bacterium]
MKISCALFLKIFLLFGCSSHRQSGAQTNSPFSEIFVHGQELYLVIERPMDGVEAIDSFVAKHANTALKIAESYNEKNVNSIVFFFRDNPKFDFGSWGAFTITELEQIAQDYRKGKEFHSLQDWPGVRPSEVIKEK